MNVPLWFPRDDTTPYPVDFERVVACSRDGLRLGHHWRRALAARFFDRVPFLVSFDGGASCRFVLLWELEIPGGDRRACNVRDGR